jgi:hypothetical protein
MNHFSGNDYLVPLSQFTALYKMAQANGDSVDLNVVTQYRNTRFQESINNPNFFKTPFSGVVASSATWPFNSITGDYPDSQYAPSYEKIPDNWYKCNLVDYYTIPYLAEDSLAMGLESPEFFSVGGNTGETNTFTGVYVENLTDGIFNASNPL